MFMRSGELEVPDAWTLSHSAGHCLASGPGLQDFQNEGSSSREPLDGPNRRPGATVKVRTAHPAAI